MSLSTGDLTDIRNIIDSALSRLSVEVIHPIRGEVDALRSDVREIYDMLAELPIQADESDT